MSTPKVGDVYCSVGSLQHKSGIEKWTWGEDVYDFMRMEIGNVFKTSEQAKKFKDLLINIKNKKRYTVRIDV